MNGQYRDTEDTQNKNKPFIGIFFSHVNRRQRISKGGRGWRVIRNQQYRDTGNLGNKTENEDKTKNHNSRTSVCSSHMVIDVRENQREKKRGQLIMDNTGKQATLGTRQRTMIKEKPMKANKMDNTEATKKPS